MKKYLHIALMLMCVFIVSSCKDDDNKNAVIDEAWKLENEVAFQAKATDSNFVKWNSTANDGFVFARRIKEGHGKQIYFNSRVKVYYKGSLINGKQFDQQLFEDGAPFCCAVSHYYTGQVVENGIKYSYGSVITGWTVALQNMVEGDKWEVWIPQELGYGSVDKGEELPPYSTLVFELEIVEVPQQAVQ